MYLKHGVYTTTVEMNDEKWPSETELSRLWLQHRASMYAFLETYLCQGITIKAVVGQVSWENLLLLVENWVD